MGGLESNRRSIPLARFPLYWSVEHLQFKATISLKVMRRSPRINVRDLTIDEGFAIHKIEDSVLHKNQLDFVFQDGVKCLKNVSDVPF
ncbi:hypothetical protein BgiBS90_030935 [Biomphalaria glabrata]|nr:hypothetical protein BgiBS90_030935 [Biomphalaria glabrata]